MILQWAESDRDNDEHFLTARKNDQQYTSETRGRFARLLGRPVGFMPQSSPGSVGIQVATDAYALRHHAAETLVRLTAALSQRTNTVELGVWEALSTGPNQLDHVVRQICEFFASKEARMQFARLVLREQDLQNGMTDERASLCRVFAAWVQVAIDLLRGEELHLNAAHNKIKHGLSVRARDDLKVTFVRTLPSEDGTIPVGALTGPDVLDIFDQPVIEVLAQAPKVDGHKQGLELTQLRVDVAAVLAETYMIAWTHAAMFHVAASKHFEGRVDLPDYLAPPDYPGLPTSDLHPEHVSGDAPLGMRFPLTTPPGGGFAKRSAGLALRNSFLPFEIIDAKPRKLHVVADEAAEET